MLHLFYALKFLILTAFPSEKLPLAKIYYSTHNPGGSHTFQRKLVLKRAIYREIQYPTSATPLLRTEGAYKIKGDTLILWKQKVFAVDYRSKPRNRKTIPCPTAPGYSCEPDYYLIRLDSLLSIYYSEKTHAYQKGSFFFVASH